MRKIYLDNAATSYPKPDEVGRSMVGYLDEVGANIGRGGYHTAYTAAGVVLEARERICALLGFSKPRNLVFTSGVTASLNMLLKGLLLPGDHLLTSSMEHNAVMRPLLQLEQTGVKFDRIPCNPLGELELEAIPALLRANTRAVVMTHASNVCGTLLPIAEVGQLCRERGIFFIVDAAQTAGIEPMDINRMGVDALAFTGHKALLGPQGVGGFTVTDRLAQQLTPLIAGGTGSFSQLETMPDILPDRFEAGTMNLPGIYGLNAALQYLEQQGVERLREQERQVTRLLIDGLSGCRGARVFGVQNPEKRVGVVSADFKGSDNAQIAFRLDSEYGVMTRVGLHCAPHAHKTLGTYPQGTVRFSVGPWTTAEEISYAVQAVEEIL